MKFRSCLLLAWFAASSVMGQEPSSDEAFFNLISPIPNAEKVGQPASQNETAAMLQKWKTYEQSQTAKLSDRIKGARQVASEMLIAKALTADPSSRERLATAAKRVKELNPDLPLAADEMEKKNSREAALVGKWKQVGTPYDPQLLAGGLMLNNGTIPSSWHWIDAGVGLLAEGKHGFNIFWAVSPGKIYGINGWDNRFVLEKIGPIPTATTTLDPILVNLNKDEHSQRKSVTEDLETKRSRMVAWLLKKAAELPSQQTAALLPEISELESATTGGVSRLSGTWTWENNLQITFRPGGLVAMKNGTKIGSWGWTGKIGTRFAVVLNGGKTVNDIQVANCPVSGTDVSVTVQKLGEGKFTAIRVFP